MLQNTIKRIFSEGGYSHPPTAPLTENHFATKGLAKILGIPPPPDPQNSRKHPK